MKTLLVWGSTVDGADNTRLIITNLRKNGIDIKWEWPIGKHQETDRHLIPADCDFVLILKTFMGHSQVERIVEQAKKRNLVILRTSHRWSFIQKDLEDRKIINGVEPERIQMAATPDKAPEALVIGGYLQDRPEIISRMIHFGWKVKDHWLASEGGHEYNKPVNGIKLIVVLRDTLENKQYQQSHTLGQLSRVPSIKWDINRELFRKRMEQMNLAFAPLETEKPVNEETVQLDQQPIVETEPKVELSTPVVAELVRRTIMGTGASDSLVAACKNIVDELLTNPLFEGVTVRVQDDGSATILPIARKRIIRQETKKEEIAETPATASVPPPAPVIEPARPVTLPAPPRIELPIKPKIVEKGRGKGHLKGHKLNMDCRFPGCKARSMGPRFGFFCKPHQSISEKQKKIYQFQFNQTHVNP